MFGWFKKKQQRVTMADIARIRLKLEDRSRQEDALFDIWCAKNLHRFPLVPMRVTSASNTQVLTAMPTRCHLDEFRALCKDRGL